MAPRRRADTPYRLIGRDRSYNEPRDIGHLVNDQGFWELLRLKGFERFLTRCQTFNPNVVDRAKLTWRPDGTITVDSITFELSPANIHASTGLPNRGMKLKKPVVPNDVRLSLAQGERLKKYAGGYNLDELSLYKAKIIKFLKGFIHCNGHPNDKKFHLFHFHMADHFKAEGEGFYPFDFCDWISRDFADTMAKVRNGIRYDPSHGAVVFMIFIDAFNSRPQNARGLVPPHEDSEGDSNEGDDDSDGGDDGGDGGEGSSIGLQPQRPTSRQSGVPTGRSGYKHEYGGARPSVRPCTLDVWQPHYQPTDMYT